jgi:2-oxo-3-hexenedioate decarboxylase
MLVNGPDLKVVADDVLASLSSHRQIPTFSSRAAGLTVDQAYQVTALVRVAFETRGEKIVGRKIGFTNREMWKVYGVRSPIWGYVTDHTMHQHAENGVLRVKDPLQAGEIISTGTLTMPMPVRAGETWTTNVSGTPLDGPTLRFE